MPSNGTDNINALIITGPRSELGKLLGPLELFIKMHVANPDKINYSFVIPLIGIQKYNTIKDDFVEASKKQRGYIHGLCKQLLIDEDKYKLYPRDELSEERASQIIEELIKIKSDRQEAYESLMSKDKNDTILYKKIKLKRRKK